MDELAQGCRPLGLPRLRAPRGLGAACRAAARQGALGGGWSSELPLDQTGQHEAPAPPRRPPRPAACPEGTGVRWVQLRLQAETGLTFNPELLDCLAPLSLVSLLSVFWLLEQFTQHGFSELYSLRDHNCEATAG